MNYIQCCWHIPSSSSCRNKLKYFITFITIIFLRPKLLGILILANGSHLVRPASQPSIHIPSIGLYKIIIAIGHNSSQTFFHLFLHRLSLSLARRPSMARFYSVGTTTRVSFSKLVTLANPSVCPSDNSACDDRSVLMEDHYYITLLQSIIMTTICSFDHKTLINYSDHKIADDDD